MEQAKIQAAEGQLFVGLRLSWPEEGVSVPNWLYYESGPGLGSGVGNPEVGVEASVLAVTPGEAVIMEH